MSIRRPRWFKFWWKGVGVACVLFPLVAACGSPGAEGDAEPLLILAASSLESVLPVLLESFEETTGARTQLVLGATGSLAAQVRSGAPADVFLAADGETVGRLVELDLVEPAARGDFAVGRLALVVKSGESPAVSLERLADPRFEIVAIANPEHAPYGAAAVQTLENAGLWEAIEARVVYGENISQTLQFVRSGNADAALVALSLVARPDSSYLLVDARLHAPIRHEGAVLAESRHPLAAAFLDFLKGEDARTILADHGFDPPGAR